VLIHRHLNSLPLLVSIVSAFSVAEIVDGAEWQFTGVDRVVAVADIHGAHDAFLRILTRSGLINSQQRWVGSTTHLVVVGDVLDRGPDSRRAMDLIMRLQLEASAAGGAVHFALGNHELMNLTGDLRYVSAGEYAAFADDESSEDREISYAYYSAAYADSVDSAAIRAEFDFRFPPGFFAHRAAFSATGVYGSWLLEQPILVVIDDTAFVHGGLSSLAADLDAEGLNTQLGQQLVDYVVGLGEMIDLGILRVTDGFYDHEARLTEFADNAALGLTSWSAGSADTAQRLVDLNRGLIFEDTSPLWYRGNVGCSILSEKDRLQAALDSVGVDRVVVGHTPTSTAQVMSRMDETVLRIDTGMNNDFYGGQASALVIENGTLSVIYEDSDEVMQPIPQPRRVAGRTLPLDVFALENILATAEIVSSIADPATGGKRLTLISDELEVEAIFVPAVSGDFVPDVAAYRLDRLLTLDMVPVTVVREIDGELGALQLVPQAVITETIRAGEEAGAAAWCRLRDQFKAMYIFDSLLLNDGRTPETMLYRTDNYQLVLVGHRNSLPTGRGRPTYLRDVQLALEPAWQEALSSLDDDGLAMALEDVLDRRRIRALLRRRDALLRAN
jgi:hypothetical protein